MLILLCFATFFDAYLAYYYIENAGIKLNGYNIIVLSQYIIYGLIIISVTAKNLRIIRASSTFCSDPAITKELKKLRSMQEPLDELKSSVIFQCWYSLIIWFVIISIFIETNKLSLSHERNVSSFAARTWLWATLLLVPVLNQITVMLFKFINTPLMFAVAGLAAWFIYSGEKRKLMSLNLSLRYSND